MPVPAEVTLVSWAMAAKVLSNELTVSPGAGVTRPATGAGVTTGAGVGAIVAAGDGVAEDEQPVTMAATAITDTASFLVSKTGLLLLYGSNCLRRPAALIGRGGGGLPENGSGAAALKSRWLSPPCLGRRQSPPVREWAGARPRIDCCRIA